MKNPDFTNAFGMQFVKIPQGSAWLGGSDSIPGSREYVQKSPNLYCMIHEITQEQWKVVTGNNPSIFQSLETVDAHEANRNGLSKEYDFENNVNGTIEKAFATFPVENISMADAMRFIEKLNVDTDDGFRYRLPKSDEWEFICRGGPISKLESKQDLYMVHSDHRPQQTVDRYGTDLINDDSRPSNGSDPVNQTEVGDNSFKRQKNLPANESGLEPLLRPCPVGCFPANTLGIYDMHGNVAEWTSTAVAGGKFVIRGGSYQSKADISGSGELAASFQVYAEAGTRSPTIGIRLIAERE